MIQCKRAYEAASATDGVRILVDRLWPRNCPKQALVIDEWRPEVAPSHGLRKAFKAGSVSFEAFKVAYRKELAAQPQSWWRLVDVARDGALTLVYAARSVTENNAVVLAEWLEDEVEKRAQGSSPVCYLAEFPEM
ncbi:MarR family transcriptional regulator [Pseudomonas chlororaphis]|uniref:MarR family transcriptional regulator n=1 Tax=Pseudomonas chlororaphis TaxID=587753 RepID=A0A0G3GKK4_9PSED|nr:MarR family transcriptional regulator [Pseudomonas chlororaphis]